MDDYAEESWWKNEVKDNSYLLTLKFPVSAIDDVAARGAAQKLLKMFCVSETDANKYAKLQRIHKNGAPEKVEL
jgi:hypothetical protein